MNSNYNIDEQIWFSEMSVKAKESHMKKVFVCKPQVTSPYDREKEVSVHSVASHRCEAHLDVSVSDCHITTLSSGVLDGIWAKAELLITSENSIVNVPWMKTQVKAKLVKSSSAEQPHLVKAIGDHYKCDDRCQMFKGFSLCSHVVAVAQLNGELAAFLAEYSHKIAPNLSAIAQKRYADWYW